MEALLDALVAIPENMLLISRHFSRILRSNNIQTIDAEG
jgi:hypothetical protein